MKNQIGSTFLIGKSHVKNKTICQDRAIAIDTGKLKILVVSDGMGSYEHAHLGAEFAVNYIKENADNFYSLLKFHFDNDRNIIWDKPNDKKQFRQNLIKQLFEMQNQAEDYAFRIGLTLEDLHCTLSFVLIGEDRMLSLSIGDSPIFIKKGGKLQVISEEKPEGENVNITHSVMHMELSAHHFNVAIDSINELETVVIMSDGCLGYEKENFENDHNIVDLPKWYYKMIKGKVSITDTIIKLVKQGYDDCSFAFYVHDPMLLNSE